MCKLNYMSFASPERLLVGAVRERVSTSLADWIGTRIVRGADIADVEKQLTAAIAQVARIKAYCSERDAEAASVTIDPRESAYSLVGNVIANAVAPDDVARSSRADSRIAEGV